MNLPSVQQVKELLSHHTAETHVMCSIIYMVVCVCVFVGSAKNPQRCLRGVGPHQGLWETDAVAEDAEETERAGAPSTGLLSGAHSHRHADKPDGHPPSQMLN